MYLKFTIAISQTGELNAHFNSVRAILLFILFHSWWLGKALNTVIQPPELRLMLSRVHMRIKLKSMKERNSKKKTVVLHLKGPLYSPPTFKGKERIHRRNFAELAALRSW